MSSASGRTVYGEPSKDIWKFALQEIKTNRERQYSVLCHFHFISLPLIQKLNKDLIKI